MQSSHIPLISSIIPCINDLICIIDDFKDNPDNHPAVRSTAIQGLMILNKYYKKTDETLVYWIAMGMVYSVNTWDMTSLSLIS